MIGFLDFCETSMNAAAVLKTFDVKRNTGGILVFIEPFDQISEIDIAHVADGDQFIKANLAGVGGGIHGDQQGAAL